MDDDVVENVVPLVGPVIVTVGAVVSMGAVAVVIVNGTKLPSTSVVVPTVRTRAVIRYAVPATVGRHVKLGLVVQFCTISQFTPSKSVQWNSYGPCPVAAAVNVIAVPAGCGDGMFVVTPTSCNGPPDVPPVAPPVDEPE
jgi:hypothetical protein